MPTESDYQQMIGNKTGGLFRLAVRLTMACSGQDNELLPLINLLGRSFQIRAEYRKITSASMTDATGYAEDLSEGKSSFLVIHAI